MQPAVGKSANNSPDSIKNLFLIKIIRISAAVFVLISALAWKLPLGLKHYGYSAVRELVKAHTVIGAWHMDKMTSEHFYIKFLSANRAQAELALETAERFYRPVTQDFGFSPRFKIPIILYSSREELNKSFGWEAKESAMGVYWAGAIRVLSPAAWVEVTEPERVKDVFISSGPMAHELAHLMVDYLTGGNYPRWFTEGVAQYEEYKLTGFEFTAPAGSPQGRMYSMKELAENFDGLPDQSLAYRESLAAVRYIVHNYGEDALHRLIEELGRGPDFNRALKTVTGLEEGQFEKQWMEWAAKQCRT